MTSSFTGQAAVLIAVSGKSEEQAVLLTLRAEHLNNHGGEVAFPGGMWEPEDESLCFTALRETREEVGLEPADVDIVTELAPSYTRQGIKVTPYVGRVAKVNPLQPNPDEIADIFWMPLAVVRQDLRARTDIFVVAGREYWAPVYEYASFTVWGVTARILLDFVCSTEGITLNRAHSRAPEVVYEG